MMLALDELARFATQRGRDAAAAQQQLAARGGGAAAKAAAKASNSHCFARSVDPIAHDMVENASEC
jgi:hypothetical protein